MNREPESVDRLAERIATWAEGRCDADFPVYADPIAEKIHDWLKASGYREVDGRLVPVEREYYRGLYKRYNVTKTEGDDDPNACYFVLRLDNGGDDKEWIAECRKAAFQLGQSLLGNPRVPYLHAMAKDLLALVRSKAEEKVPTTPTPPAPAVTDGDWELAKAVGEEAFEWSRYHGFTTNDEFQADAARIIARYRTESEEKLRAELFEQTQRANNLDIDAAQARHLLEEAAKERDALQAKLDAAVSRCKDLEKASGDAECCLNQALPYFDSLHRHVQEARNKVFLARQGYAEQPTNASAEGSGT